MTSLRTHDVPAAVDPSDWQLRVTGAVSRPLALDRAALSEFPVETVTDDFECLAGWTGTDLSWRGVRVGNVLDRAGPDPTLEDGYVLVRAMDGDYACSFPMDRAVEGLLAVGLDSEALAVEHGGPARFVPVDDSECWESVKWVSELEVRDDRPVAGDTAVRIATERLEGV